LQWKSAKIGHFLVTPVYSIKVIDRLMETRPIHQNLSTSFVNLAALASYLRSLNFVGRVQVELSSYEGEIVFNGTDPLEAREQDHSSGRVSFGDDALRRILVRATEPHGQIHVYRSGPVRPEPCSADCTGSNIEKQPTASASMAPQNGRMAEHPPGAPEIEYPSNALPAPGEWMELLNLTEELLREIDEKCTAAGLDFETAFRNSCVLAADKRPFIDPEAGIVSYRQGTLRARQRVPAGDFAGAILDSLGHILSRLSEEPRFSAAAASITGGLGMLIARREPEYRKYAFLPKLAGVLPAARAAALP
jgi:hypothetical protein